MLSVASTDSVDSRFRGGRIDVDVFGPANYAVFGERQEGIHFADWIFGDGHHACVRERMNSNSFTHNSFTHYSIVRGYLSRFVGWIVFAIVGLSFVAVAWANPVGDRRETVTGRELKSRWRTAQQTLAASTRLGVPSVLAPRGEFVDTLGQTLISPIAPMGAELRRVVFSAAGDGLYRGDDRRVRIVSGSPRIDLAITNLPASSHGLADRISAMLGHEEDPLHGPVDIRARFVDNRLRRVAAFVEHGADHLGRTDQFAPAAMLATEIHRSYDDAEGAWLYSLIRGGTFGGVLEHQVITSVVTPEAARASGWNGQTFTVWPVAVLQHIPKYATALSELHGAAPEEIELNDALTAEVHRQAAQASTEQLDLGALGSRAQQREGGELYRDMISALFHVPLESYWPPR